MRIGTAIVNGKQEIVVKGADGVRAVSQAPRMVEVIADWQRWGPELKEAAAGDTPALDPATLQWLAPVMPDKLICVGINYTDHVAEMESAGAPKGANPWPFSFMKAPRTTMVGHETMVTLPGYAEKIDWEAELALVIGDGSKASSDEPLDAVFGYSVLNDLSVRDHIPPPHALGMDATVSKGFDQSAPMGPWIVTADEIEDPTNLGVRSRVNGELKQDSNTSQMVFGVREILAHFARVLTLSPGDVIATGTPAGVGAARRPPEGLHGGDVVEAEVEGIGVLRTTLKARPEAELLRM